VLAFLIRAPSCGVGARRRRAFVFARGVVDSTLALTRRNVVHSLVFGVLSLFEVAAPLAELASCSPPPSLAGPVSCVAASGLVFQKVLSGMLSRQIAGLASAVVAAQARHHFL
jgi:hypothetical protein